MENEVNTPDSLFSFSTPSALIPILQYRSSMGEFMTSGQKAWRCEVCGYIHYGDEPPDECPVCGASASEFEAVEQAAPETVEASAAKRIIIAGAGIAGVSAAEAAREAAPDAVITLLSAETEPPYYRLNLTRYLAGEVADRDLPIHSLKWYEDKRIDLMPGTALAKIFPTEKEAELNDGSRLAYDKLIVATGAHPFVPPIPGSDQPHVHTVRTADDAKTLLGAVSSETQVVCIASPTVNDNIAPADTLISEFAFTNCCPNI